MIYPKEILLIEVPNTPDIPGLRFRRSLGSVDFPQMLKVAHRANLADDVDEIDSLEDFTAWYDNLKNTDPEKDLFIAEVDDTIVGYGRTTWAEMSAENEVMYRSFFTLDPEWRNKGIGHAIFPVMLARCDELATQHDDTWAKAYQSFSGKGSTSKTRLLEEFGFEEERFFFTMKADLSKPLLNVSLPEGLEIRPVEPAHYPNIFWALDEAFRDHWGHEDATDEDYKKWVDRIKTMPSRDPSIWVVAWEGDEVAGMVLNAIFADENKTLERKWGWTDPICVRRPWRKRGLASALIVHSQKIFRDTKGMEFAALGVDTQNANGALGLYERCGYEMYNSFVAYRKKME